MRLLITLFVLVIISILFFPSFDAFCKLVLGAYLFEVFNKLEDYINERR